MTRYLGTIHDTEKGQDFDVYTQDGGTVEELRNALRDHRDRRNPPPSRGGISIVPGRRSSGGGAPAVRPPNTYQPAPHQAGPRSSAQIDSEHVSIRKDAVLDLVSVGGELCAAFLGRPDMPKYVGDPSADFTNATLHRDALARHEQNRERIRAVTGLVERAARILLD